MSETVYPFTRRSAEYQADLRNLVTEMRRLANDQQEGLDHGLFRDDVKQFWKLTGLILGHRNDADELECWLNAVSPAVSQRCLFKLGDEARCGKDRDHEGPHVLCPLSTSG